MLFYAITYEPRENQHCGRKVSTRISLSMPRRLTRMDTFRLLWIFCFRSHYALPLFPDRRNVSARILIMFLHFRLTPIGVFSLIIVPVAGIKDVGILFGQLGMFCAAVIIFIIVQQTLVLPLILFLLTRRNPYYHMSLVSRPWLISFAASST